MALDQKKLDEAVAKADALAGRSDANYPASVQKLVREYREEYARHVKLPPETMWKNGKNLNYLRAQAQVAMEEYDAGIRKT